MKKNIIVSLIVFVIINLVVYFILGFRLDIIISLGIVMVLVTIGDYIGKRTGMQKKVEELNGKNKLILKVSLIGGALITIVAIIILCQYFFNQ